MARVRALCGPSRSQRSAVAGKVLVDNWGRATLLVPTRAAAAVRLDSILRDNNLPGVVGRPILTFDDFVKEILRDSHPMTRIITDFERQTILGRIIEDTARRGQLDAIGEAAHSPGFRQHALRVITQLKQAGIEPDEFARRVQRRKNASWADVPIGSIYRDYQSELIAAKLYDRVGLYWTAEALCVDICPPILKQRPILVIDGFDDFTPSEFRLLVQVCNHLEQLHFALNCDTENPSRADRDTIPLHTLATITERFPDCQIVAFQESTPQNWIDRLSDELFWRDRPTAPSAHGENVRFVHCHDALQEAEQTARIVKQLLVHDNAEPATIAIVYRHVGGYASLLEGALRECGIPYQLRLARSIMESQVVTAIMRLLIATHTWSYESVAESLASPWLRVEPFSHDLLDKAPVITRAAGYLTGSKAWSEGLVHLARRLTRNATSPERDRILPFPSAPEDVITLQKRLDGLRRLGESMPAKATLAEHSDSLEKLIIESGCLIAVHANEVPSFEAAAISALRRLLSAMSSSGLPGADQALSRADFIAVLQEAAHALTASPGGTRDGVVLADAELLRNQHFDHVVICGLNEGEFPARPMANAIYQDEDLRDMAGVGIFLDDKRLHQDREARLFHAAVKSASISLHLLWHALAPDGRAALASPFLLDAWEILQGDIPMPGPRFSLVLSPDSMASVRDLRNAAFHRFDDNKSFCCARFPDVAEGCHIERARHSAAPFDEFDGMLRRQESQARLVSSFGANHIYSVSQLETYAQCPFQFLMERVIRILDVPEPSGEFDAMLRGSMLHVALEQFHRQFTGRSLAEIALAEAEGVMNDCAEAAYQELIWKAADAPPGAREAERRWIRTRLQRYLQKYCGAEEEVDWRPTYFEWSFGRKPRGEDLPQSEAFRLSIGNRDIAFSGQVDRVDCGPENTLRIVDYKTTATLDKKLLQNGIHLQLPIYAMAVEQILLPGNSCESALLLPVGRVEEKNAFKLVKKADVLATTKEAIERYLDAIGQGHFAPTPYGNSCYGCGGHRPCRFEKARIERKIGESSDGTD